MMSWSTLMRRTVCQQDQPSPPLETRIPLSNVSRIYLLGERNSGTSYVEHALFGAFRAYSRWPVAPDLRPPRVVHHNQTTTQPPTTGHNHRPPGTTRFRVIGTGTRLQGIATGTPQTNKNLPFPFAMDIPVLEFKHMFRQSLLNETEYQTLVQHFRGNHNHQKPRSGRALFVLVVRSPCEWADGMRRKPWHLCPTQRFRSHKNNTNKSDSTENDLCHGSPYISMEAQRETQAMSLHDFSRQPWREFPFRQGLSRRNHQQSQGFDHIFQLRTLKLQLMAQVIQAAQQAVTSFHPHQPIPPPIVLIHLPDFEAAPHRAIVQMAQRHGLTLEPSYGPWNKNTLDLFHPKSVNPVPRRPLDTPNIIIARNRHVCFFLSLREHLAKHRNVTKAAAAPLIEVRKHKPRKTDLDICNHGVDMQKSWSFRTGYPLPPTWPISLKMYGPL